MRKLLAAGAAIGAAAAGAWSARGRASEVFGPGIWHGPRSHREIALTFDDGPSAGTNSVLDVLSRFDVRATFFVCGANVRALPNVLRDIQMQGHEIGNHSFTHPLLALKSSGFVRDEFLRAQNAIRDVTSANPRLYRAPYGVRWFGLRDLPLTGVMWDVLARDWVLPGPAIGQRVLSRVRNGSIVCFHDGRELDRTASIAPTLQAIRWVIPKLMERGYRFRTVSELCPKTI